MQVNGSVNSRYTDVRQQSKSLQRGTRFVEMAGLDLGVGEGNDENTARTTKAGYADSMELYMAQNGQGAKVASGDDLELEAYKEKLLQKIQNGDVDTAYQIGAQEYTEKQWKEFLERFDSIEEMMRELMRERHKKEQEKREERERLLEEEKLLTAQTTVCTYPTADPTDADIRYITWYTEEGIFCRKAGQAEGYEWAIAFENQEQYKKVTEFIAQFPEDWNLRFAAHENFWRDFLNNTIPMDEFMKFIKGTNKGVFVTP